MRKAKILLLIMAVIALASGLTAAKLRQPHFVFYKYGISRGIFGTPITGCVLPYWLQAQTTAPGLGYYITYSGTTFLTTDPNACGTYVIVQDN
jgi:hypothetical protein